jgi:hypothetical protein
VVDARHQVTDLSECDGSGTQLVESQTLFERRAKCVDDFWHIVEEETTLTGHHLQCNEESLNRQTAWTTGFLVRSIKQVFNELMRVSLVNEGLRFPSQFVGLIAGDYHFAPPMLWLQCTGTRSTKAK